jgi:hypothetical protein
MIEIIIGKIQLLFLAQFLPALQPQPEHDRMIRTQMGTTVGISENGCSCMGRLYSLIPPRNSNE